jgi:hypothetical protein
MTDFRTVTLSTIHAPRVVQRQPPTRKPIRDFWRDIKTDNVLIDDDGDAVVLDFGGGNTIGWVDREKYGSTEGE